jgi:hypothetical protein
MDIEAWILAGSTVIALVALFFTGLAAKAAVDQTKIQRQLRIDAAQPYVWADLREDKIRGTMVLLVLGNSGPTVATDIKVTITPELRATSMNAEKVQRVQERLANGFQSLAPGREVSWSLGVGFEILEKEGGRSYSFKVEAMGPFGPLEPLTYVVDMDDWRSMRDNPSGDLHQLTKSIDKVAVGVSNLVKTALRD